MESLRSLRATVVAVLASALALLLPGLALGVDEAGLAGALLAIAVAALLVATHETLALGDGATPRTRALRRTTPLVLATRPTDPTHHPLRPRAPGRV